VALEIAADGRGRPPLFTLAYSPKAPQKRPERSSLGKSDLAAKSMGLPIFIRRNQPLNRNSYFADWQTLGPVNRLPEVRLLGCACSAFSASVNLARDLRLLLATRSSRGPSPHPRASNGPQLWANRRAG
jgi:hypothetical protein